MISAKDAFIKVAAICARQEKCVFDIEKKLYDWQINAADIAKIIDQLIEEKFIDETRYIRVYVKDKFNFNKWGKVKIRYQLKAKNISGKMVDSALDEINKDEYFQTLMLLLEQKKSKSKETDPYKQKASLVRFASSRGFEPNFIYNALDDLKL
ncbi:regulatory protein RecX [Saccharicrinis aurantiacus]|uniref:regulatory protein RecX n=1 Tax=Saccharicrinis aurantiacus TaxID=1849719 RepID=UPI0008395187|nr:regulatory protein RecX [Saccharicrinis aurantiacus]